jgi:hypothetical protein
MAERPQESPIELRPVQAPVIDGDSLATAATLPRGMSPHESGAGLQGRLGPGTAASTEPMQNADNSNMVQGPEPERNANDDLAQDLEQGLTGVPLSRTSTASSQLPKWTTPPSPRVSIIVVDRAGGLTKHPRAWGNDPAAIEPAISKLPQGCVRIIIQEVGDFNTQDLPQQLLRSIPYSVTKVESSFQRDATFEHILSDVFRPFAEGVMEIDTVQLRKGKKFNIRHLQELLKGEKNEESSGFIIQSNVQGSSFHIGTAPPGKKNGNLLISKRQIFNHGTFRLSIPFWEVFTAVRITLLEDERAEGEYCWNSMH